MGRHQGRRGRARDGDADEAGVAAELVTPEPSTTSSEAPPSLCFSLCSVLLLPFLCLAPRSLRSCPRRRQAPPEPKLLAPPLSSYAAASSPRRRRPTPPSALSLSLCSALSLSRSFSPSVCDREQLRGRRRDFTGPCRATAAVTCPNRWHGRPLLHHRWRGSDTP